MEPITQDIFQPRFRYQDRKGIYPIIEDFDDVFKRLDTEPLLVNQLDLDTEEGKEKFNSVVYSRYDGDVLSNVPSCGCRALIGGTYLKRRCEKCGTLCLPVTEQSIEPIVWVKVPDSMPGFMNLTIYRLLKKRLMKSGFSALDYLMDPNYRPPKIDAPEELVIRALKVPRGLVSFHKHFDMIMQSLCNSRVYMPAAKGSRLIQFIDMHRKLIFCKYIPFPSKIGFIVENVGDRTYVDPAMTPALDALISLAHCAKATHAARNVTESRISRSISRLSSYYADTERLKLFEKKGVYRKLLYGVSPHFTFRTVVTSNHGIHKYDSLAIPWGVGVLTFKLHIANKLLREDYTPNEINTLIYESVWRPHWKLEEIFDTLIAESPNGRGMPATFTRFPVLKRGSTQAFFIDQIKRNPTQLSTSISIHCLVEPNCDAILA